MRLPVGVGTEQDNFLRLKPLSYFAREAADQPLGDIGAAIPAGQWFSVTRAATGLYASIIGYPILRHKPERADLTLLLLPPIKPIRHQALHRQNHQDRDHEQRK